MFFCNLVPLKYLNLSWRLKELNYLEMTGFSGRPGVTVADLFQDFCYKNYQKCHNIDLIKACLYLFYFYLTNSNAKSQIYFESYSFLVVVDSSIYSWQMKLNLVKTAQPFLIWPAPT